MCGRRFENDAKLQIHIEKSELHKVGGVLCLLELSIIWFYGIKRIPFIAIAPRSEDAP